MFNFRLTINYQRESKRSRDRSSFSYFLHSGWFIYASFKENRRGGRDRSSIISYFQEWFVLIRLTFKWQRESKRSTDRSSFVSFFKERLLYLGLPLTGKENRRGAQTCRLFFPFTERPVYLRLSFEEDRSGSNKQVVFYFFFTELLVYQSLE